MNSFLRRFGPLLAKTLREWAAEIDRIPGSPRSGTLTFTQRKDTTGMADITVPDNSEPLNATVSFVDAEGNPTTADDIPTWASSDENAATVQASDDGLTATVEIGSPGATVISVSTTNDDGSTAAATGTITVEPGDAVLGEVNFTPSG